jgi:hypothetical protein
MTTVPHAGTSPLTRKTELKSGVQARLALIHGPVLPVGSLAAA